MLKVENLLAADLSNLNYGNRIGFVDETHKALIKTNPRGEIGKFGIAYHGTIGSLFHRTIDVTVTDANTRKDRKIHLNRESTIKWLNSQLDSQEKVSGRASSEEIVAKINRLSTILKDSETKKAEQIEENLKQGIDFKASYPAKLNHRPLYGFFDRISSFLWGKFYDWTISSWNAFRLRFGLGIAEKTWNEVSEKRAAAAFRQALQVPAYKQFLDSKGGVPRTFADLPITSKDNYIKPHIGHDEPQLYLDGKIPEKAKRDTSTGTSGKSTPWYRGAQEQERVELLTSYAAKVVLGDRPYTFINGFAVGPWATGITATLAMNRDKNAGVCVIGPNISEIYDCIKEQIRIRPPGYPIVVGGYPPHIRAVIDMAVAEGFPLHEHNIIAVVGGESMSEDMRDLIVAQKGENGEIIRTGLKQCFSSYGASDLDINIGYESDFEIELRKLCHKPENKALAEELFGKNEFKPMIFHYDPLNYLIEADEQQNLIYTCVRQDRISPRIRYNLGDRGKIMAASDVLAVLEKHGIKLKHKPNTNLPLLFVWGRQGSHISFRGCKVAPENLGETIRRLDSQPAHQGLNEKIAHYGFYQYEKNGRKVTEILLEFNEEGDFNGANEELLKNVIDTLAEVNSDFITQIQNCPQAEKPVLRVFKKGESPMDIQQKKYPMRKKQYIFTAGDEFIPAHEEQMANKGKLISLAAEAAT
ncbi:hypothetical protein [Candidatus Protochlamydia phocaeensis]|uniref:hypothetical protein n=1 Tax=Candidatus Protochlamydia phocaeensis TaxID=1414722 RepID=UPI0008391B94|nr:hypothetical protein [Candidatus Protochlamydia phocaeensis]